MHLGHVRSTYIPADIYVRFLRLRGEDVKYVCGTDEHGTPIGIAAEKEGKKPKEVADYYHEVIEDELRRLGISFDIFSQTSKPAHHEMAQDFFKKIKEKGYVFEKSVKQLYCVKCKRFLPDRYVEGICAFCGSAARGDHCEVCGRHLNPEDLKEPRCIVCSQKPEIRETKHFFFKLSAFTEKLRDYIGNNKAISSNARNYALQWLTELRDWDITRDFDWGVKIPGTDKIFYVWWDAPIGYVSFTKELTPDWRGYWKGRVVHFIGKDIIYHHVLFWPAMLMAFGEFLPPAAVQAGGFLSLEGEKMSTSRGHVVWIKDYLAAFPPDYLRYYLISASALDQDIDFSWKAFMEKTNNELIANYGNFVNRVLSFCKNKFDGVVPELGKKDKADEGIIKKAKQTHKNVTKLLEEFNFPEALREILNLSKAGNEYFQNKEPWKGDAENTINIGVNLVRNLAVMLSPFLPFSSEEVLSQVGVKEVDWQSAGGLVIKAGHRIGEVKPVFKMVEKAQMDEQIKRLPTSNSKDKARARQ
jgi:methionyl-tRNA synthetase